MESEQTQEKQLRRRRFYFLATGMMLSYLMALISIFLNSSINGFEIRATLSQICIVCITAILSALREYVWDHEEERIFYMTLSLKEYDR